MQDGGDHCTLVAGEEQPGQLCFTPFFLHSTWAGFLAPLFYPYLGRFFTPFFLSLPGQVADEEHGDGADEDHRAGQAALRLLGVGRRRRHLAGHLLQEVEPPPDGKVEEGEDDERQEAGHTHLGGRVFDFNLKFNFSHFLRLGHILPIYPFSQA